MLGALSGFAGRSEGTGSPMGAKGVGGAAAMLRIVPLIGRGFARLRRPLVCLMILPCLSMPDFAVDEFHVKGKALRSWIHDLNSVSDLTKIEACQALESQGSRSRPAARALVPLLREKEFLIRICALHAFIATDPPPEILVPALIPLLQDAEMRWYAAQALADVGPEARAAIPALIPLLKGNNDIKLAECAAYALGEIGPDAKEAVPALCEVLFHSKGPQSDRAWNAILAIGSGAAEHLGAALVDPDREHRRTVAALLIALEEKARPARSALRHDLEDEDMLARIMVAHALWNIDHQAEPFLPVFFAGLKDPKPIVRMQALRALGAMGADGQVALPEIRELTKTGKGRVRLYAAFALWKINQDARPVLPIFAELLESGNRAVIMEGVPFVAEMGSAARDLAPNILKVLKSPD